MAKKKINFKSVSTDVESGDVNISYKNVRIAGLSEPTTAVLETKDTICEDDIEVEYTMPTPNPLYFNFSVYGLQDGFESSATFAEIMNAYANNQIPVCGVIMGASRFLAIPISGVSGGIDGGEPAPTMVIFTFVSVGGSPVVLTGITVTIDISNNITVVNNLD